MNTQLKPVKTEYKGIVFDSKSEAVFARILDLLLCNWEYHPKIANNHEWDFYVHIPETNFRRSEKILIEYKPSVPTLSYIENISKKASLYTDENYVRSAKEGVYRHHSPVFSAIVCGNLWERKGSMVFLWSPYCFIPLWYNRIDYGYGFFNKKEYPSIKQMRENRPTLFQEVDFSNGFHAEHVPLLFCGAFERVFGTLERSSMQSAMSYRFDLQ